MSKLIDALNRIMNWLEEYQPEYAASFLPSLSRSEVDELIKPFNIVLPEEIYELYQWRNGREIQPPNTYGSACPSIHDFLPLHYALSYAFDENSIGWINSVDIGISTPDYKDKILFPFLGHLDPDLYAVAISNKQEKHYFVLKVIPEDNELIPICPNITSMMFIFAEAYETGAYYIDRKDRRCTHSDFDKLWDIVKKHGAAHVFS